MAEKEMRRWAWRCLAVACVWSLVLLIPVLSGQGWPFNHDAGAPVLRMAALAEQWQAGHWLPVWSTAQQFGYGSPMPALYHKTHMALSALVFAGTGSVKASLVLPLFGLMVLGFCGMCFCLRHALQGRHPWLWLVGGAALLASNYSTTDWVVRGAFAELAAMMLIPWLLAWCCILVGVGRWPQWIGPLLALLALSHSSLAVMALVPLGLAFGAAWLRWKGQARQWLRPALSSVGMALLLLVPFVLPMMAASHFSRVERLGILNPRLNHKPWQDYLWDPAWSWGRDWRSMTIQLDLPLLLLLPLYLAVLAWPRAWCSTAWRAYQAHDRWLAPVLLGTLLLMGGLQLESAIQVFERVPGLQYLQFAWRLLAYITVVLIVCGAVALSRLCLLDPPRVAAGRLATVLGSVVMLAWMAYPKMWWNWGNYEWFSHQALLDQQRAGDYTAFGEFFPRVDWPPAGDGLLDAHRQMSDWLAHVPPQACQLVSHGPPQRERSRGYWGVDCPHASSVALPVFLAPGMRVSVRQSGATAWQPVEATRTCSDPRLQIRVPQGPSEIQIKFPNWSRMAAAGFFRQGFDFRRDCVAAAR